MDLFEDEIIVFFERLNQLHVKYIIVGGLAVNYYGFNRSTGDIDVWIEDSKLNREYFDRL